MVDRATGDDGDDLVAVAAGVVEAFEPQHAAAFGAGVPVGVGGERLDPAVREEEEMDRKEMEKERQAAEMFEVMGPFSLPAAGSMRRKFSDLLMLLFLRRARGRGRSQPRNLCRRRR